MFRDIVLIRVKEKESFFADPQDSILRLIQDEIVKISRI